MGIQITLTDEDAQRYLKWAANIRQPRQQAEEPSSTSAPTDLATRRDQLKDIRQWATKHGFKIAAKGRIPQPVMEAYERAH
ncbi:nucloid associated Lsr2-like [Streptomyces phage Wakanda]|uniref:Lsr2-like DNA bridging protein n=2 Tax=Wakandavirus TaxID=3044854 RepID=A0A6G8R3W6_9CAUD|nr:nucloid associated Lsr2-like [Streptomyces phage Wakanda]YP_010652404.1 nucloid associated Lsr2-like [Streptomyces phage Muntaha]QIN94083.1 Lsr2-like DNA bridging protein [Streptomyces phage Wakanda]QIN94648.1 Lsr2-like DNA bridging protein [Streptomyces phage Muntaha]